MIAYRLERMDEPGLYRIVVAETGKPVLVISGINLWQLMDDMRAIEAAKWQ